MDASVRRGFLATLAAATLGVAALSGCSSTSPLGGQSTERQMFHWAGDSTVGGALPNVKSGRPYIFYIGALCVEDTHKPATVTGVTLRRPQGSMRILNWGFRHRYDGDPYSIENDPGAAPGLLSRLPGFNKRPVAIGCHHTPPGTEAEFDVNVERGASNIAVTHGFWVHYTVDGIPGRALAPYTLTLCQAMCP